MLQISPKTAVRQRRNGTNKSTLFCQCHRCLETLTIDAVVKGRTIIKLDPHSHVRQGQGIKTHHHCGGNLTFFN